jgi:TolB-like protein
MSLYTELKRRNVFRVAVAYLAVAWLITEVAGTLFPAFGIPDWSVRFIVILFTLGFIPALVFSWVYELTPDGLKREKDVVREASVTHVTARRLDIFTIALIMVALAFVLADRMWLAQRLEQQPEVQAEAMNEKVETFRPVTTQSRTPSNSIVVLPFVNMSADADNEYFSDGISEELLNLLAKVPELRVISRSSAFYFKGKNIKVADIASELNVAHVLEGSVRKAGERVRITAQLIEASTDTHVWSETYDRTLNDIFAIQDEIAAAVVDQLKLTLLAGPPQTQVVDPRAYTLYLQAAFAGSRFGPDAMEQSNDLLRQTLAIDPNFARAWRLLARNLRQQTRTGALSRPEGDRLSRQAIERALAIDPDLAVAHSWLAATTAGQPNADLVAAAASMQRAIDLEPANLTVLSHAASFLHTLGRLEDAIEVLEYVLKRDPLGPIIYNNLGWNYLAAGRPVDALSAAKTLRLISPNYGGLDTIEGMALLQIGDHEAAVNMMLNEPTQYWRLINLVRAYHTSRQTDKSDAALADLIESYAEDRPYWIASVLAYRNETDRAFEWLDRAVQKEDFALENLLSAPEFDSLGEDPRWLPFLRRIGKSPVQLSAIELEVNMPD